MEFQVRSKDASEVVVLHGDMFRMNFFGGFERFFMWFSRKFVQNGGGARTWRICGLTGVLGLKSKSTRWICGFVGFLEARPKSTQPFKISEKVVVDSWICRFFEYSTRIHSVDLWICLVFLSWSNLSLFSKIQKATILMAFREFVAIESNKTMKKLWLLKISHTKNHKLKSCFLRGEAVSGWQKNWD